MWNSMDFFLGIEPEVRLVVRRILQKGGKFPSSAMIEETQI